MKKIGLILLILVALVIIVFLTGCYYVVPPIVPPTQSFLTVTAGYWVWGEVYLDGKPTGKYIDYSIPSMTTVVLSVPYNTWVTIYIVDPCGESHTEYVYIYSGNNYLYFAYW